MKNSAILTQGEATGCRTNSSLAQSLPQTAAHLREDPGQLHGSAATGRGPNLLETNNLCLRIISKGQPCHPLLLHGARLVQLRALPPCPRPAALKLPIGRPDNLRSSETRTPDFTRPITSASLSKPTLSG
jgi:hypothetical protein